MQRYVKPVENKVLFIRHESTISARQSVFQQEVTGYWCTLHLAIGSTPWTARAGSSAACGHSRNKEIISKIPTVFPQLGSIYQRRNVRRHRDDTEGKITRTYGSQTSVWMKCHLLGSRNSPAKHLHSTPVELTKPLDFEINNQTIALFYEQLFIGSLNTFKWYFVFTINRLWHF